MRGKDLSRRIWGRSIWGRSIWGRSIWGRSIWAKGKWGKHIWGKIIGGRNIWGTNIWRITIWSKTIPGFFWDRSILFHLRHTYFSLFLRRNRFSLLWDKIISISSWYRSISGSFVSMQLYERVCLCVCFFVNQTLRGYFWSTKNELERLAKT